MTENELRKIHDLPEPELTPKEQLQSLMAFRNEWILYPRKCDATGKQILSAYSADSPFKVYNNAFWWGDDWSALDYGRSFDFKRPFSEQFLELQLDVPREGTSVFNSENCEYNSHIRESKNCYLNSLVYRSEDLYYSSWAVKDKDVFDSLLANNSTLCSWCVHVDNGYQCVMLEESQNCNDCFFSYQLKGCNNCIFCSNLANKSYHAFNKPCTKEEFEEIKSKYLNGSWKSWQEGFDEYLKLRKSAIHKASHNINCENCSGDHLTNCKNCENCYNGYDSEDCSNTASLDNNSKDIFNCYSAGWPGCEMVYISLVTRGSKEIFFSNYTWFSNNLWYCDSNNSCNDCFGCIGLKHQKYCILNKQYTKEEYEQLLPRIIAHMKKTGEWGRFFTKEIYPFAYNETAAQEFFPLTKEEATKLGWRWREPDQKEYLPATVAQIPDNIKDIDDTFTKEILACETCHKNYKLIAKEIDFYKKMNLPAPITCPTCRHKKRFDLVNPLQLYVRTCDKCKTEMKTTYSPKRPETVYCDKCYLKEVY